jgi:hypothetical protein
MKSIGLKDIIVSDSMGDKSMIVRRNVWVKQDKMGFRQYYCRVQQDNMIMKDYHLYNIDGKLVIFI